MYVIDSCKQNALLQNSVILLLL